MQEWTFEDIKEFVKDVRWEYPFDLHPGLLVEQDLKITGDEAVEFIIAFGKQFNVDVTKFKADEYFESEGIPLNSFLNIFRSKKANLKKTLTLGDLENALKTKVLI